MKEPSAKDLQEIEEWEAGLQEGNEDQPTETVADQLGMRFYEDFYEGGYNVYGSIKGERIA